MDIEERYKAWVEKALIHVADIGPKIKRIPGCVQTKPFFDRKAEIMFLGINPAENYGWDGEPEILEHERQRFFAGNECRPESWGLNAEKPAHRKWNWIFNPGREENSFHRAGWDDVISPGNYLFFNLYMFGSAAGASDLDTRQIGRASIGLIGELITQILRPKRVICLSTEKVFKPLRGALKFDNVHLLDVCRANGEKIGFGVWRGDKDGVIFYGINHISWPAMRKEDFDAAIKAIKEDKI